MSMIANLRRVRPEEIRRLLEQPEQITRFLYGEEAAAMESGGGFLSRLFGRKSAPIPAISWPPPRKEDVVDLDKSWHALHFLFTGTAWKGVEPESYLLLGGREIGDVDVGYGPARALMPDEVRRFHEYLQSLTTDELRRRYDPQRMTELKIYPEIWEQSEDEAEGIGYVLAGFETLRNLIAEALEAGDGVVIYVS